MIILLIASFAPACNRKGGITAIPGGLPSSSPTPAEISNSGHFVAVVVSSFEVPHGGSVEATVRLSISPGYHINANPASYPYLIATEITPGKAEGVSIDKPKYPAAKTQKFQFAEEPLDVYEGDVEIKLPLKADAKAAAGERSLPITVRVQACDTEKCFPPATLNSAIPVIIK